MSDQSDKQPIKKRSLSSYLSNVTSRKEELIKIAQREKEKQEYERVEKERLEKEKIENETLERERLERDRIEKEKLEKQRIEIERVENERLQQEKIKNEIIAKERLEKEKQNVERMEQERFERERQQHERISQEKIEKEKRDQQEHKREKQKEEESEKERIENAKIKKEQEKVTQNVNKNIDKDLILATHDKGMVTKTQSITKQDLIPEIHTENISHIIHHVEKRNDDHLIKNNYEKPIKDQKYALKANIDLQLHHTKSHSPISRDTLKSLLKEPKSFDDDKESDSDNHASNTKKEDDFESFKEIDSEGETEEGSPVKSRRGKLVRGDKMNTSNTNLDEDLMFANNSDSDLSDIEDDMKSVAISSSFLHDNSSPQKGVTLAFEKSESTKELFPSSPVKRIIPAKEHKKSHVAVSKHGKTKKGLYRDSGGRTKLQIACDKGKIDVVRSLLAEGDININDQDNAGNTPLHEAALNGHIDIVELLVEEGANINMQSYNMFQDTPLIDASANGHLDVVSYLLKHNADPTITNAKGITAYEAIEEDSELDESEKELVNDIKKTLRESTKVWNVEHDGDLNGEQQVRGRRSTPGSLNQSSRSGTASRHDSVERSGIHSQNGNNSMDKDHMANEEIPFYWNDITTATGKNKLLRASKDGNLAYVGQYLENGGRPDFKSFFEAVKFGHSEITSLFLAFGASINSSAKDGITPLMISVGRDHLSTVKLLLEAGANVLARDKADRNVLFYTRNSIVGLNTPEEIELIEEAMKKAGGSIEIEEPEIEEDNNEKLRLQETAVEIKLTDELSKGQIAIHRNNSPRNSESMAGSENSDKDVSIDEDEEEEDVAIPISRRTASPALNVNHDQSRKRQTPELDNDNNNNDRHHTQVMKDQNIEHEQEQDSHVEDIHDAKRMKHDISVNDETRHQGSDKLKKVYEETAEEKEQRLKAEEEYRLRKIHNKKLKEQEMLHKMQEDERKRDEEKAKQKVEQVKKLEQVEKEHQLEIQKQKEENELSRRRNIRSRYPLGLKIISNDMNATNEYDYTKYLPLIYTTFNNDHKNKFILDLQLQVILSNNHELYTTLPSQIQDLKIPITIPQEKKALWNMTKFIFLYGGVNENEISTTTNDNDIQNTLQQLNIDTRLEFENQEFSKFSQLPLNWIPWDNVASSISQELRTSLEVQMVEAQLTQMKLVPPPPSLSSLPVTTDSADKISESRTSSSQLPIKLQHRHVVANLCHHYRRRSSTPTGRTQRQFAGLWQ